MKKIFKALAICALAGTMCAGMAAFAGCGDDTETLAGEYSYVNPWDASSKYGIKVDVKVKDGKITKVTIVDSDYIEVSDNWDDKAIWNDGVANLLKAYEGKDVMDVLKVGVSYDNDGVPQTVTDDTYVIAGATQGSGRLLLAVKAALLKLEFTAAGEYSYPNPWDATSKYGVKVEVKFKDQKITKVTIVDSDYIVVSSNWDDKAIWNDGVANLLKAYEGKTIQEVMMANVEVDGDKVPTTVSNDAFLITGATQGSGRLLLAVQNAIMHFGE